MKHFCESKKKRQKKINLVKSKKMSNFAPVKNYVMKLINENHQN